MKRAKVLTPEAAGRELARVMAVIAQKREALRDLTKERQGEIAKLEARGRQLMDIANGAPVQVELDTTEESDDEQAAGALKAAAQRRDIMERVERRMDDEEPAPKGHVTVYRSRKKKPKEPAGATKCEGCGWGLELGVHAPSCPEYRKEVAACESPSTSE